MNHELRSAPPHNNGFDLTARGHHAFRLRESRAGALRLAMARLRPCSQINPALYGLIYDQEIEEINAIQKREKWPSA